MLRLEKSLTAQFCYIFPEDDAVNQEDEDFDEAMYDESFDPKYLPLVEGGKPTKFYCKPLSRKALVVVADMATHNSVEAMMIAVVHGLRKIEGEEGNAVDIVRKRERITDKCMDELFNTFGVPVLQRVGSVILSRSTVSPL